MLIARSKLPDGGIEFRSVAAKGWFWSHAVRVEVSVDGGTPPDGRDIRYPFMTCVAVIDCVVLDDIFSNRYGLGLCRSQRVAPPGLHRTLTIRPASPARNRVTAAPASDPRCPCPRRSASP